MIRAHRILLLVLQVCLSPFALLAQQPRSCQLPVAPAQTSAENFFSEEQENWLGEVMVEQLERDNHVVRDPELNDYVQRIGDRLLAHMPATKLHFRFALVDLPDVNAFSLPGGYVFVHRKMVSFAQSDDELAAVLAHEMGHIFAHQGAITMTQLFKDLLHVTSVGDKADITDKYNRFLETRRKKQVFLKETESQNQLAADRIGVYALALSGYDPASMSKFWDRFAQTGGKTGGFWSDFFGTTTAESKRLREMMKQAQHLPAGCQVDAKPPKSEFAAWQ